MTTSDECKHGLRHGCIYCHGHRATPTMSTVSTRGKRTPRPSRVSEQMNERMAALKKRLREIRGE